MLALVTLALLAGCRSTPDASMDLRAALEQAASLKEPLVILVAESGQSPADDRAISLMKSRAVGALGDRNVLFVLDVSVSRNRAAATRFHALETPLLVCLSSRGVIASRDEKLLTKSLVLQRIAEVSQKAPALDTELDSLAAAASTNTNDTAAQFALTDFLLAHQNALEAVPTLEGIAHSETTPTEMRVRAWVDLVRAHFWIAEPEKGRHVAEGLIATLGPGSPEARAGGELVLGMQDNTAKRTALARKEFEAAIAAAPDSDYGKQAAEALAKLPATGQNQ